MRLSSRCSSDRQTAARQRHGRSDARDGGRRLRELGASWAGSATLTARRVTVASAGSGADDPRAVDDDRRVAPSGSEPSGHR